MDDLDRLAFRLVRMVRNSYPHLLNQEFTLSDLEERLLPFRDARRELANPGPEAWELNMLRMVSGERQYLHTDADLQLACRQALTLPSPTIALVRPWSAAVLRLGEAATNLGNDQRGAPAATPPTVSAFQGAALRLATPSVPSPSHLPPVAPTTHRNTAPGGSLSTCGCRYCGGRLPDSRTLTFCPHCGVNLTVRQCPACSTELDVQWRFCVTCGRGADVPELSAAYGAARIAV